MERSNYPLIVILIIVFTAHFCAHGMKRSHDENKIVVADIRPTLVLPDEIADIVFGYVQHNMQKDFNPHSGRQLDIAKKSILIWFIATRSVCKDWYNRLLRPASIKRILRITEYHIIDVLSFSWINATKSSKDYSHVQFFAQMLKKQDASDKYEYDILVDRIRESEDSEKLKILLENGLVHPGYQVLLDKFIAQDTIHKVGTIGAKIVLACFLLYWFYDLCIDKVDIIGFKVASACFLLYCSYDLCSEICSDICRYRQST